MEYSLLDYLWFFVIYSFLGWCVEVAFHVVKTGKFINRGFLNGPVCPIYGTGMVILIFTLRDFVNNTLLLFVGAVIMTSVLEYITGFILEKVFNDRWWDYSELPFNLSGYICLAFSLAWGLGALIMLRIIHPPIAKLISFTNNTIGHIILVLALAYFVTDFIVTVLGILKIKRTLRLRDEIAKTIKSQSDDIGEEIYKGMTSAIKKTDELKQRLEDTKIEIAFKDGKQRLEDLKKKLELLRTEKGYVHKRLEKAFPRLKERLEKIEEDLKI